jgi:hypothetical protein
MWRSWGAWLLLAALGCTPEVSDGGGGGNNGDNNAQNNDDNNGDNNAQNNANNSANNGDNNPQNNNTGPILTPCTDNLDCRGGEVCRGGFCREACAAGDPCQGELAVCDEAQGYCVACVGDENCGADEACQDQRCVFYCRSDEACGDNEYCGPDGACLEAQCGGDGDCPGGFRCDARVCVPIDALVCEPGRSACEDNVAVVCSRDGTREEREPCGGDLCAIGEDGDARCVPQVCEPNAIGCDSEAVAYACNSTGTSRALLPCEEDEYCQEGRCVRRVCEPGAVSCDGDFLQTCDALGGSLTELRCDEAPTCDGDDGCTCRAGACVDRLCTPGQPECVGNATRTCREDGLGYTAVVQCGAEETCNTSLGVCVSDECTPGATECAGDTLLTCAQDGSTRTTRDCQASDRFCSSQGTPRCLPHVCPPGERVCAGDVAAVCNNRGSGLMDSEDCGEQGLACVEGLCAATCEPGARRCQGNTVLVCQNNRTTELASPCPGDQICQDGSCIALLCVPNQQGCDGDRAAVCNDAGTGWRSGGTDCAAQGQLCEAGGCVTPGGDCPNAVARARVQGSGAQLRDAVSAAPLATVELDGRGSQGASRYEWSLVERPQGSSAALSSLTSPTPTLFLDLSGRYAVQLVVYDADNTPSCSESRVVITASSEGGIRTELVWDVDGSDLDLHLLHPNGRWNNQPLDCYYVNPTPDWGPAGPVGNPSLDLDDVNGLGPENLNVAQPEDLEYTLGVHYFDDHGQGTSRATVRVYFDQTLAYEYLSKPLTTKDQVWEVAVLDWDATPSVRVIDSVTQGFPTTVGCANDDDCAVNESCVQGTCQQDNSGGDCTDAREPNNSQDAASTVGPTGTAYANLTLCPDDADWFLVNAQTVGLNVEVTYSPSNAQLRGAIYDSLLQQEITSATGSNGTLNLAGVAFFNAYVTLTPISNQNVTYTIRFTY